MPKIFNQVVSESVLWGLIEKEENKYLTCCKLLLKTACIYYALLPCSVVPDARLHWLVFSSSIVFPILCLALCPGEADVDWLHHRCLALWLPGGSDHRSHWSGSEGEERHWCLLTRAPPTQSSGSGCILWQPLFQTHNLVPGGDASCFPKDLTDTIVTCSQLKKYVTQRNDACVLPFLTLVYMSLSNPSTNTCHIEGRW